VDSSRGEERPNGFGGGTQPLLLPFPPLLPLRPTTDASPARDADGGIAVEEGRKWRSPPPPLPPPSPLHGWWVFFAVPFFFLLSLLLSHASWIPSLLLPVLPIVSPTMKPAFESLPRFPSAVGSATAHGVDREGEGPAFPEPPTRTHRGVVNATKKKKKKKRTEQRQRHRNKGPINP